MKKRLAAALFASVFLAAPVSAAPVPKEQLLVPPADAKKFAVVSAAGEHGKSYLWTSADGCVQSRESVLLRGMVWEMDQVVCLGPEGRPKRIVVRGVTPTGDAAETFEVRDGSAAWKSQIDAGNAPWDGKAFYVTEGGPWSASGVLAEALYRAPGHKLSLLPAGEARLVKLTDLEIGEGANRKRVTAYNLEGMTLESIPLWLDEDGKLFAFVTTMGLLPEAYAKDFKVLQKAQIDALAARGPAVAKKFGAVAPQPVAFTNVKLFDAEAGRFLDAQTVVADKGRIVAVGAAASVRVPSNARRIDGSGKTLVPGIWDAHMHVGDDSQGAMLLAIGVTSGRNPGSDIDPTILRNKRIAAGELLFPTIYSSVLIDGKGPLQAQGGFTVTSAEEAIKGVRMAKENGFTGVKFYTSMKREWLLPAVAEAKKLGLHVHGHVPATMRPSDAIKAGYDEITHINFVIMEAMPDAVVNVSNGIARFQGPGRYGKDVDLSAEPMRSLIADMAARKIVSDPTLVVYEGMFVPENGDLSPAYASFVGTLPPATERGFRRGGFAPPEGVTRADYRASFGKLVQLVNALDEAGVPIVAGTDGNGLEIIRELELYVQAGMTPAEALQTATIMPARLVKVEKETGSIAVGKEADMVLVDGDPSRNIGDLRRTEWVMSDGKLMNADELRATAGFTGRPR